MRAGKLAGICLAVLLAGCSARHVEREIREPAAFKALSKNKIAALKVESPFLKAHMKSGTLCVFESWNFDDPGSVLAGKGILFNALRDSSWKGQFTVGLDSVAILETNVIRNSGAATAMTIFAGITAAVTVYCIVNPKACFGSCPTFYVSDGDSLRLQAEGFSSSIAPSLEATDIDALYHARPLNGMLSVEMRNEALETHVVRHVDLLAVPRHEGSRVFVDNENHFWESCAQIHPDSAQAFEGNCLPTLLNLDGNERFSLADDHDLAAKETIDLKFRIRPGRTYGLVLGGRQSLLPTYLLYQTYAYMGSHVGHWMAEIERKHFGDRPRRLIDLVGGIEVSARETGGRWRSVGNVNEAGPLATDVHLVPLGRQLDSTVNIQLRLTKGAWRIDYAALAEISGPASPVRLQPCSVLKDSKEDADARHKLLDPTQHLVTLPGDSYTLRYALPKGNINYELFLESRGYYLEWVRKEWIEEENSSLLSELFMSPEIALRRLAAQFKRVEPQMEDCFWRSRYAKP